MNRKISTLLTADLLMAGSLCGSAFAQKSILDVLGQASLPSPATELENDKYYLMTNSTQIAYGFDTDEDTGKLEELFEDPSTGTGMAEVSDVQKFIWQVTVTENVGAYSYKFTNVATGKTLRIDNSATPAVVQKDPSKPNQKEAFVFGSTGQSTSKFAASSAMFAYDGSSTYQLTWNTISDRAATVLSTADVTKTISFYEVKGVSFTDAGELNDLYNGSGFTFDSKRKDDQKSEPNGNLFNEKRITAVCLNNTITSGGSTIFGLLVDATDYPTYTGDAKEFYIPNGMYFFTENAPIKADGTTNTDYKAWLNATIVAVSSTETVEASNADRATGNGFSLTEMKVSDMNFYQGNKAAWKTAGNEVSINNANFTVNKSYTSDYPYELSLDNFRYRKQNSKADHVDAANGVKLWVLTHSDDYYLTTTSNVSTPQNIFRLAPAGMKEGIELLNEEAKVAAFNIRVLSGNKNDVESLYGKYLTNAVNSGSFQYVAKAKVLSQPETPAYQWAITSVDNKYNVTFTNRETGEHFTAGLFPKADLGENVYEMAIKGAGNVTPIYVDENTYNEAVNATNAKSMNALIVELIPSEIDPEAGFLNVDDKTLMTMAFARDVNETSNKWYVGVYFDRTYKLNKNNEFSNELSGAAQWQLVKNPTKKTIIERSFVYNKDGRVTVQAKGDKAYAYEYQLQYVNDGKEMDKYFPKSSSGAVAQKTDLAAKNVAKFFIKEAADGAVYLIESKATSSSAASIFNTNTHAEVNVILNSNGVYRYKTTATSVYAWPVNGNDLLLKTYLIEEAPEISYPAKDGHISLVSEKGNYISVNEECEGIVVDKEQYTFYLQVTDEKAVVPSFYISKKGAVENGDRLFLFNPMDSVSYLVTSTYDRKYQWAEKEEKALFKTGSLVETKDTLATVVKGNAVNVAAKADDEGVLGGLDRFKVQIILVDGTEDQYYIRSGANSKYLYAINDKLAWVEGKTKAMQFTIPAGDPTSNESVADAAEGIKVIAGNGIVEIQGAAGKTVAITNVLGKVIANTVLTSDNATIAVPAGIVVVAVEGEEAVKAVVK